MGFINVKTIMISHDRLIWSYSQLHIFQLHVCIHWINFNGKLAKKLIYHKIGHQQPTQVVYHHPILRTDDCFVNQ